MISDETVFHQMIDFVQKIGISIRFCGISQDTFLPGLLIENGTLLIDKAKLKYIGDTLHEAGHIALMTPTERQNLAGALEGQIDAAAIEMAAIAWSYAACLEIGIEPKVVIHPDGYKGDSENILYNFSQGHYFGVPILEWFGMTERVSNVPNINTISYPKMVSWLRM